MDEVPIIFVHIGKAFPHYIRDAIAQARLWNPTNPIHVIVDLEFAEEFGTDVELINIDAIPPSDARIHFNKTTRLNAGFRDGFWKYATERLLVLADYLEFCRIECALHLENDNMIYASLRADLRDLFEVPGLRCTTFYDHRVLFNFLVINGTRGMRALANYLAFQNLCEENEMSLGKKFMDKFPAVLSALPGRPEVACDGGGDFVFDAAPFGQYFGGIDPRNGDSVPGFINRDAPFFPNMYSYRMEQVDGKTAISVFGTSGWKRLAVLHIHSKMLSEFSSENERFRGSEHVKAV